MLGILQQNKEDTKQSHQPCSRHQSQMISLCLSNKHTHKETLHLFSSPVLSALGLYGGAIQAEVN